MSDETKAIEETAKAAQELAKTGSKALDATRDVGGWLDRLFGEAIEHTVARLWTDRAGASRIEAAIYDYERLSTLLHNTEKSSRRRASRPRESFLRRSHCRSSNTQRWSMKANCMSCGKTFSHPPSTLPKKR